MIDTNLTKEDLQKLKDDPFMKLASLFLGKDEMNSIMSEVEKKINAEQTTKEKYVAPKVKVEPVKIPTVNTVYRKVKIDKDKFEHFMDGFCIANDTVAALEHCGLMFTEDSPIIMYENLISGLLESIFGKDVAKDITAYAYGNSTDTVKNIWDKIEKSI